MSDPVLSDVLDAIVEPMVHEQGDWNDVLRRARVHHPQRLRRQRPTRRRLMGVCAGVALIALLLIVLATPAFGLRQAVLDLFGRSDVDFNQTQDAPTAVRKEFNELDVGAPAGMAAQPFAKQARLVGTFKVGGIDRALYIVPAKNAGFCYQYEAGAGGCLRTTPGSLPPITTTISARKRPDGSFGVWNVSGEVLQDDITSLSIEFADGTRTSVPFIYVSNPIDAGFFSYDVPGIHQERTTGPVAVIGNNQESKEIWREAIRWPF